MDCLHYLRRYLRGTPCIVQCRVLSTKPRPENSPGGRPPAGGRRSLPRVYLLGCCREIRNPSRRRRYKYILLPHHSEFRTTVKIMFSTRVPEGAGKKNHRFNIAVNNNNYNYNTPRSARVQIRDSNTHTHRVESQKTRKKK